jgi:predicted MFS family arabinose efflux permease
MTARPERRFTDPVAFALAFGANFFAFSGAQMVMPQLPLYVLALGLRPGDVGLVMGAYAVSAILMRPVAGRLIDRRGAPLVLFAGAIVFVTVQLLYIASSSLAHLVLIRLLMGAGIALLTTAFMAVLADLSLEKRRGEAMGLGWLSTDLSMALMPPLGIAVQGAGGYDVLFAAAAGVCLLGVACAACVRVPRHSSRLSTQRVIPPGLIRRVWGPLLGIILYGVGFGTVLSFMPLLAEENGIRNLGWFWSVFAVTQLLVRVPVGRVSDRLGRRWVALVGMLLLAATFVVWNLVSSEVAFFGLAGLFGVATVGTRMVFDVLVIDHVIPTHRGRASAIAIACFDIGVGVGSFGVGLVISAAGDTVGTLMVAGLCLLGTGLIQAWRPEVLAVSNGGGVS